MVLRTELTGDREFLARLYLSTRWEETGLTPWPDELKAQFLMQQFALQTIHYQRHYPEAARAIIEVNRQPAGRLYLQRMPGDLRIVDISLLPEFRAKGFGTALLRAVCSEAEATGSIVSLHVEAHNPAQGLYSRLGFVETGNDGAYKRMEWRSAR